MSLFNSQTIFSILFTLLIGVALYYYIRYKTRILELTVREQAKVLQSVIMNMNSNNENIMNMVQGRSHEELTSDAVGQDMNRVREVNSNNELIEVSDDSDSDSDGDTSSESESESSTSSESDSESGSDDESEHGEEPVEDVANNGTRKIVFNGGNDCHVVEHLDGPDVKVIELTHPLYPKNENEVRNGDGDGDGDDADEDDEADNESEDDADEDEDSDSESISSELDGPHEPSGIHENYENHENHENYENYEIKENADINDVTNQIQNHLEPETISEVILGDNSLDNLSVKTVFKTKETKETEPHSEYTSMNVQSLRQLLKSKLTSEGTNMSEASINKLTKKELIKHLS
jgi:hypothetical protein